MPCTTTKTVSAGILIGLIGCADAPRESMLVERRDSAGVEIVESAAPAMDSVVAWRLSDRPVAEIGAADGSGGEALYRVSSVGRLSDGRIIAVDGGSQEIRFFTQTGEHIRSVGRKGSGPGEFETLYRLAVVSGDTILAADLMSHRVTIFDSAGALARTLTLSPPDPGGGVILLCRAADGTYYTAGGKNPMYMNLGDGRHRGAAWISRLDAEGEWQGNVIEFEGGESMVLDGGRVTRSAPFARSNTPLLVGDQLIVANDEMNELKFYTLEGELKRIAKSSRPIRPVTSAEIEEFKERSQRSPMGMGSADNALEFPETHPAFGDVMADVEGNVWVQDYRPRGSTGPVRWSVVSPTGAWLTDVEIPDGYRVMQIGSDYILGVWRDDMGVEFVRMYEVHRN